MIPEAKITILNEATGVQQVVQSSSEGNFVQPYVLPGLYTVTVEKEGFDKSVTTGIRLNVQQTVALELALKVGNVATTVEVTADAVQLSTSTSSVATVIQGKAILDLPLNGRNPFALANTDTGRHSLEQQLGFNAMDQRRPQRIERNHDRRHVGHPS